MNIDSLQKGIVIDHIRAGVGMRIYELLELDKLDCCVAVIKNARSTKYGRKDIIKIEGDIEVNLDILGFIDHNITVDVIEDGKIKEKKKLKLPHRLRNVVSCRNPRCITSIEPHLDQVVVLSSEKRCQYRCIYCEQEYTDSRG